MKNISEKDLKKATNTLVTYGLRKSTNRTDTDTTIGTDPTNTTLTLQTSTISGIFNNPVAGK